jgi:hypothetical protein
MRNIFIKLGTLVTILAALLCCTPARANLLFSVQDVSAIPGSAGDQFDILLTNPGPDPMDISGFSFEVSASSADVTFEEATTATVTEPYIFDGNSYFGPITSYSSPGQLLDASDIVATPNSFTTVAPGETLGLGLAIFDVDSAAAPGSIGLEFNVANSSLTDGDGNPITVFDTQNGSLDIVPEPGTLGSVAFALVLLGIGAIVRRGDRTLVR